MPKTNKNYILTLGVDCNLYDFLAQSGEPDNYPVKRGDQFKVISLGSDAYGKRYATVHSLKGRPLRGRIMFDELHKMEEVK